MKEGVPLTISYHLYFLRISEVSNMSHHGSLGGVHRMPLYIIHLYMYFLGIFLLFFININQSEIEWVIRNCPWNCMVMAPQDINNVFSVLVKYEVPEHMYARLLNLKFSGMAKVPWALLVLFLYYLGFYTKHQQKGR